MSAVLDFNILTLHLFPLLDTPVTLFNLRETCRAWKAATESFKDWEELYRTEFSHDAWVPNYPCSSWFTKYWIRVNAKLYAWNQNNGHEIWSFGLERDYTNEGDVAFRELETACHPYFTRSGYGNDDREGTNFGIEALLGAQVAVLRWTFESVYRITYGRRGRKARLIEGRKTRIGCRIGETPSYDEDNVKLPQNDHFADSGYRYQSWIRRFSRYFNVMHSMLEDHKIDDVSCLWGPPSAWASGLSSFVALSETRGLFVFRNIECYSNCPATMVHIEDTDPRSDPQNQVLSFAHGRNFFIFVTARGWPYRYDNVSRQEFPKELMDLVAPQTRFIKVRVDASEDFFALITDKGDLILLDFRDKQCGHHVAPVKVDLPFVYEVDIDCNVFDVDWECPALSVYTAQGLYFIEMPRFDRTRCIGRNCGNLRYHVRRPNIPRHIGSSIVAVSRISTDSSPTLVWAIGLPVLEGLQANVMIHRRSIVPQPSRLIEEYNSEG